MLRVFTSKYVAAAPRVVHCPITRIKENSSSTIFLFAASQPSGSICPKSHKNLNP